MKANRTPSSLTGTGGCPVQIRPLQTQDINSVSSAMPSSSYFRVFLILKGRGAHWIDMQKSIVENQQLILLRPGQIHQFEHPENQQGFTIYFKELFQNQGDSFIPLDHLHLFRHFPVINIQTQVVSDLQGIVNMMMAERSKVDGFNSKILLCYFDIFLTYVIRQVKDQKQFITKTRNVELVEEFMSLLEHKYREEKLVCNYASQLRVTPNYLNEVVKKVTGCSAGHQIRSRLILEAKRRAIHSGLNMKEIAYWLGFKEVSHFSKLFKNVTGKNFTDFKRQQETAPFQLHNNLVSLAKA